MPQPIKVSKLRDFLSLTEYYRKFMQDYGIIVRPLTDLLKKGRFQWGLNADQAFNQLKKVMTSTPTLALPDFDQPFTIEINASKFKIGAILSQIGDL